MTGEVQLPDELMITGRTASYTYRTPGKFLLKIPSGLEVRAIVQGAQGGGGGAGYSSGGHQGGGGGRIAPGSPGGLGGYKEGKWMSCGGIFPIEVGEGGKGGRGVQGLHGAKGADGWVRVEIRRIGLRRRLRYISSGLWSKASQWLTWQNCMKAGAIGSIIGVPIAVIAVTCG